MTGEPALFHFDPERHRDARLMPGIDLAAFAAAHHVKLGLSEISDAAADYPLAFLKDATTGQFRLVAVLGLVPGANAYLHGDFWQAVYLPQEVVTAPFTIAGPDQDLCINEGSALVSTDVGEALFDSEGQEAAPLLRARALLNELAQSRAAADGLIASLLELALVRPVSITVQRDAVPDEAIEGLYTVSPLLLAGLDSAALIDLHRRDFLGPAYVITQSLAQFNRIRQLHNLRSSRPISAIKLEMEQR